MKLNINEKYCVEVLKSDSKIGIYILYFRGVFIDKYGFPVFNFSESLEETSVFHNFFYPEDVFFIYPFQ